MHNLAESLVAFGQNGRLCFLWHRQQKKRKEINWASFFKTASLKPHSLTSDYPAFSRNQISPVIPPKGRDAKRANLTEQV